MRIKNPLSLYRNFSLAKKAVSIVALVVCASVLAAALWVHSVYPSDEHLYDQFLKGSTSPDVKQKSSISLLAKGSFTLNPPITKEGTESLGILEASGYLKKNPYSKNPLVRRYATGVVGKWLDEKNSLVIPENHEIICDAEIPGEVNVSLDVTSTSFIKNDTFKTFGIFIEKNGSRKSVSSQTILPYERGIFEKSQKPVLDGLKDIYSSTGWKTIHADLPATAKGKVRLIFRYSGKSADKSFAFISNLNASYNRTDAAPKYNVIHILFDAMSQNYMGIYNSGSTLTPNFNKYKKEFIILDRMYSMGTKTRISVGGFLTSTLPPENHHGYNFNVVPDFEKNEFYQSGTITSLPRVLSQNGYHTMQVGNCGFTNPVLATAVDYGFDESFEFQTIPYDSSGIVYHLMQSLSEKKDLPFYAYVHLNTTHKPRITPIEFYLKGYLGMPSHSWRPNVTGSTVYADDLFGKLVEYLKKEGLWENTIVIISSDHGTLFHASNYGRNNLLEDFAKIPFLVHLPKTLKAKISADNERVTEATTLLNLAPTILDLAGIKAEPKFRGKSIAPLFAPHAPMKFTDSRIFCYDTFDLAMILDGRWKYTLLENEIPSDTEYRRRQYLFWGNGPADAGETLVDLDNDTLEQKNLEVSQISITRKIRSMILASPHHPFVTMFSVYPGKETAMVKISLNTTGTFIRAEIAGENPKDIISYKDKNCSIELSPGTEIRKIAIETAPANAAISYTVERKGKLVPSDNIVYGEYLFLLFKNPGTIATESDRRAIESSRLYPENILMKKQDQFLVHISRIDIRYWQRETSRDDSGADTNMKQVLKSWGYIQ